MTGAVNSGRKVTIQSHAFGTYLSCDAGGDTSCSGNGFSASVSTSVGDAEKFMLGTDKGKLYLYNVVKSKIIHEFRSVAGLKRIQCLA